MIVIPVLTAAFLLLGLFYDTDGIEPPSQIVLSQTAKPADHLQNRSGQPGKGYSFDYANCHFLMLNSCLFMEERIREMGADAWNKSMKRIAAWIKADL